MEPNPPDAEKTSVFSSSQPPDLTINTIPRSVRMFRLFESELNSISSPSGSIHWTFFGVTAGAAITLGAALATGSVPTPKLPVFTLVFWSAILFGAYFMVMGFRDSFRARSVLKEIKKRPESFT